MSRYDFTTPDWQWLRDKVTSLLAAPYVAPTGGPVESPFSTLYKQLFTLNVEGVIASKHVKYEGLKDALLVVQECWQPETAVFESEYAPQPRQVGTRCRWTHRRTGLEVQLSILASVETVDGVTRIRAMSIYSYGDPTVFGRLGTFRHA